MALAPLRLLTHAFEHRTEGRHEIAFECFREFFEEYPSDNSAPSAAISLAEYYEKGEIVPQDLDLAFMLYIIAAKGNISDAQGKVAEWLEAGIYVPQNLEEAAFWRTQEAAQRVKDARPILTLTESIDIAIKSQRN